MKNNIAHNRRLIGAIFCFLACPALAQVDLVTLKNDKVEAKITPDLGGRVLGFSVPGKPNVLLINEENLARPVKEFSRDTGFTEHAGHITWVSPQNDWWVQQKFNDERKKRKAYWPPDPFLIYGKNKVVAQNQNSLSLDGVESPVSGIKFAKKFSVVKNRPGTMDLHVSAINIRDSAVSWGIWFNTRVKPVARVYVPIDKPENVRIENYDADINIPADFDVQNNFFSFEHGVLPTENKTVRSKAFIQPARGWMAAFVEGQAFIIQFPLRARRKIHPEQGQIEIYHAYSQHHKQGGLLEMELHAPYLTLEPGETMSAMERWTILPYSGENTRAAHIAFLKNLTDNNTIGGL